MEQQKHGFCLILFLLVATFLNHSVECQNQEVVCLYSEDDLATKFDTIRDNLEGNSNERQHMAFLMDLSISAAGYDGVRAQQKYIVQTLVQYLTSSGHIFVAEGYTNISVLTFSTANLVIVKETKSNCKMVEAIEDGLGQRPTGATQLADALNQVVSLFGSSADSRKTVWIFYDGDSNESEVNVTIAINTLRQMNVRVFAVGIGDNTTTDGFLNKAGKEDLVKELATDLNHYICAKDLLPLLEQENMNISRTRPDNVIDNCELYDECLGSFVACDGQSSNPNCSTIALPDRIKCNKNDLLEQWWFLLVLAVCGAIVLFVVIFFIVLCYCNLRACCAPPRPPPRVVGRIPNRRPAPSPDTEGLIYDNSEMAYSAPGKRSKRPEPEGQASTGFDDVKGLGNPVCDSGQSYVPGSSMSPYAVDYRGYGLSRSPPSHTASMYTKTRDLPERVHISYQNETVLEETNVNMDGWDTYIQAVRDDFGLRHLGLFQKTHLLQMNYGEAAWTPGFRLSGSEVRDINKCIRNGVHKYRGGDLRIASEKYRLTNEDEQSFKELKAVRTDAPEGRMPDHAVAIKAGKFVIVGVGLDEGKCLRAVFQVKQNITESQEDHAVEYERCDQVTLKR